MKENGSFVTIAIFSVFEPDHFSPSMEARRCGLADCCQPLWVYVMVCRILIQWALLYRYSFGEWQRCNTGPPGGLPWRRLGYSVRWLVSGDVDLFTLYVQNSLCAKTKIDLQFLTILENELTQVHEISIWCQKLVLRWWINKFIT